MDIRILPEASSFETIQNMRADSDCIMFDLKKLQTNDSFTVVDESFDFKRQPLRLVVIQLKDLNRDWSILNDRYRRNTMIIAGDSDVRSNPEISYFLESQGVALLMAKEEEGGLSWESIYKSLSSLKFKSILVEDRIDLIKEFR